MNADASAIACAESTGVAGHISPILCKSASSLRDDGRVVGELFDLRHVGLQAGDEAGDRGMRVFRPRMHRPSKSRRPSAVPKNRLVTAEMMQGQAMKSSEAIAARVYPVYQQQLITANAVDFDDLLLHVAVLCESRRKSAASWMQVQVHLGRRVPGYELGPVRHRAALSIDHPNLAVTGDPDQSIYGWRVPTSTTFSTLKKTTRR